MKLKSKSVLAKKTAPKVDHEEQLVEEAEKIETRIIRLAEEAALMEERLSRISSLTDEEIRRRGARLTDMIDRHMANAEQAVFYRILDYFNHCPHWELLKIEENDLQKNDASHLFAEKLRAGWRYVGYYHDHAKVGYRYTLLIRPKGGPISDGEYLKMYEDYMARREKAGKKQTSSTAEPEVEEVLSTSSTKPKAKLKINQKK